MLKIRKIILEYAANSSSSHSILILKKGEKSVWSDDIFDENYHWDDFILTSVEAKSSYVAFQFLSAMKHQGIDESIARRVMLDLFGDGVNYYKLPQSYGDVQYNIDHESQWDFVIVDNHGNINNEFYQQLTHLLLSDRVVILGGNDNQDPFHEQFMVHPIAQSIHTTPLSIYPNCTLIGVDNGNGLWSIFNPETGAKAIIDISPDNESPHTKFVFSNMVGGYRHNGVAYNISHWTYDGINYRSRYDESTVNIKLSHPLLVDYKITDFCSYDCPFCYQGSTKAGQHAPLNIVKKHLDALAKIGVFEVAIGGGEPTAHPDFLSILHHTKEIGIIPSFTTRNYTLLQRASFVRRIKDMVGAIAVSVDDVQTMESIIASVEKHIGNDITRKLHFHLVMGVKPLDDIINMVQVAVNHGITVTLLGYKTNHRGNEYIPYPYTGWLERCNSINGVVESPVILIDTVLAHQSKDELDKSSHKMFYHTKDGGISLYIDGVSSTAYASSYEPERGAYPIDNDKAIIDQLQTIWSDITPE